MFWKLDLNTKTICIQFKEFSSQRKILATKIFLCLQNKEIPLCCTFIGGVKTHIDWG